MKKVALTEQEQYLVRRRRAGITQGEAARASGVGRVRLSLWETGRGSLRDTEREALWSALRRTENGGGSGGVAA